MSILDIQGIQGVTCIQDIPIKKLDQFCRLNAKRIIIKRGKLVGIYPD